MIREELISKDDDTYKLIHEGEKVEWYKDGKLDRDGLPAIEFADGSMHYFKDGLRDRRDGPAVIEDGMMYYFTNGRQISREELIGNLSKEEFKAFLMERDNFIY